MSQQNTIPESEFAIVRQARSAIPPETWRALVPATAAQVLDCSMDPARCAALRDRCSARIVGIAPSPEAAGIRHGYDEVVHGDVASMEFPFGAGHFDCIVSDYVLPALRDPLPMMTRLARLLGPGGVALFTAPNVQHVDIVCALASGRWDLSESGALAREHLRFFTAQELVQLARSAGFKVERCGVLQGDAPERMPLDENACYRRGNLRIGPLNSDEHKRFLARDYLLVVTKT